MKKWTEFANGIQWKLVVIFTLLILIPIELIGFFSISYIQNELTASLNTDLKSQVRLLKDRVGDVLVQPISDDKKSAKIQQILNQLVYLNTKVVNRVEVRVFDAQAFIIADTSWKQPAIIKNRFLLDLPPVTNGPLIRQDDNGTTETDYLYYYENIKRNNNTIGTIYIESDLNKTYNTIRNIRNHLFKATALALFITGTLVIILARTITTPIKEIKEQATAMAAGNFDQQLDVRSRDEIGRLAMAFNDLAAHLREALTQNAEEKEKLLSVLGNMNDGVIATDLNGRVIVKNQWAEKLLDRTIQIGDSFNEILPLSNPIQFPLFYERQTFVEQNVHHPDLHTVVKVTFSPILVHGQEWIGLLAIIEDVTEQEKLDRQRKDFVANVSHELRTPLTTIKSYLEALDDGAIHDPELATRFLKVTRQESDRMARLIQDLLQLSRLDAKQSRFYKKATHVGEMLEDAVDRFSFQCKQKEIELTLYVPKNLPHVFIDRDKINQVLDNLLSNAVKYTPEGGSVAVVAQKRTDGMAEISIMDTGIGIPKQDLSRIFERFYRVDKARSRGMGGTGLGLAIAQEIVRAHGGGIEIDSIDRKGTIVSFTLPPCEEEIIR